MNEQIFELTEPAPCYVEPIKRLLAQLSSSPIEFGENELRAIVESPASQLFLLDCDGQTAGMLTLCSYLAPTGRKLWIEDVVVDDAFRGRGYGRRLVEYAIDCAKEKGGTLMLTSKPSRVAANALYCSAGFQPKITNVYRLPLPVKE
ncbi:MAG: GNAT family N-acetyltransferase [Bacteroidaceae bacterium]|nr:GNAT family N-acetyltransferase [Bacteroidaceae bacterium]